MHARQRVSAASSERNSRGRMIITITGERLTVDAQSHRPAFQRRDRGLDHAGLKTWGRIDGSTTVPSHLLRLLLLFVLIVVVVIRGIVFLLLRLLCIVLLLLLGQ